MSEEEFKLRMLATILKWFVFPVATAIVLTYGEPSIVEAIAVRIGGAW